MRPQEIEEHFRELRVAVQAGTISDDEFEAELREFLFQDDSGAYWTIGAQTEKWYQYQDGDWVQASPPEALERVEETDLGPDAESREAPAPPGRSLDRRVVLGLAGLLVFACVVMVAVASYQYGRFSGMGAPAAESPSPTAGLAQSPIPEPTATPTESESVAVPSREATPSPQATESSESPTSTPRPTSTRRIEPTPTPEPTVAHRHPAPVLLSPENGVERGPGYDAVLVWEPVDALGDDEYYHVEICWNDCTKYWGEYTRDTTWTAPDEVLRGEAIDERYQWHVTVRRQQGEAPEGPRDPATSPPSESWVFRLPTR